MNSRKPSFVTVVFLVLFLIWGLVDCGSYVNAYTTCEENGLVYYDHVRSGHFCIDESGNLIAIDYLK